VLVQDWFSVPEKNNGKLTEVYPDRGVFRAFFFSCKANARVKLAKTGHGLTSSKISCYLCCSVVIRVVLYIVCVYMCTALLSPGDNPIALNKYIIS